MYVLCLVLAVCGVQAKSLFEDDNHLSPDTFKRLAAALYQRGDKAENRLTRKFLYNRNITCNDGSPSGYYIRRNRGSTRWVVFLEGGWFCFDETSCEARWHRLRTLMSSDRWPAVKTAGGILSSDIEENPHFGDANHVLVPYCSSDCWSGSAKRTAESRFSFLGSEIVKEVIRELFSWEQLGSAQELYLAGSSAGGTGVLVNLDPVSDLVDTLGGNMRVRGIVDSGWFLDNDPYTQTDRPAAAASSTLRSGAATWKAKLPDSCKQMYPGEEWKCFYGFRIYPTLRSPLFVFQWQFDEAQMTVDNVGAPVTPQQWNYIHIQGKNMRNTFKDVSAVFSPSCISHTVITKPDWMKVEVAGVNLPDAIQCWVQQSFPGEKEITEDSYITSKYGYRNNNYVRPAVPDSGVSKYKLNSNLVRSIDQNTREDTVPKYTNSMNHRISRGRHGHRLVDNRTLKRQHKRKRTGKCRYGEGLENQLKCIKEENEKFVEENEVGTRSNRDLVRSLDTSTRQRRRRRNRNRQVRLAGMENLTKEERRIRRRQERQRLKELEKKKRKARRRAEKRQKKQQRRMEEMEKKLEQERQERRRLERKKRDVGTCQMKHVDKCSWPQCNRSCPKLHNPVTGEEMDFLELLKSFGLDMRSVASALGIELSALNNMDQDVLLHLLTSQTTSS